MHNQYEPRSMETFIPISWKKAINDTVWDTNGKKYIDFTSTIFVQNFGHSNPYVKREIRKALRKNLLHTYIYTHELREELSEKLAEFVMPWTPEAKVFMLSSGTEATETAVRLMRLHGMSINPNKKKILSFQAAMHGRTMAALLLKNTGFWMHEDFKALPFPEPNKEQLPAFPDRDWIKKEVAGIIIEGYQGWSARMIDHSYMKPLVAMLKDCNALVAFDEIQSGYYRTGKRFAFNHYAIYPDIVCVGKAIGGGLPISAVVGRSDIMDIPQAGDMSSTHSANPLCCAAGIGILKYIDKLFRGGPAEFRFKEQYLWENLHFLKAKKIVEVVGRGFVYSIIMDSQATADAVVRECANRGLLLVHTGRESVKIGMPITITFDNLEKGIKTLKDVIHDCCC